MKPRDPEQKLTHAFPHLAKRGWGMARSLMNSPEDAQDAVGSAFLVCARKLKDMPKGDLWPWFSTILYHEIRNMRRRRRPDTGLETSELLSGGESVAVDVIARESRERLMREMETLKVEERDAIVLTRFAGHSVKEAAKLLEMNEKTCSSHLNRGIGRLRERLGENENALNRTLSLGPVAMNSAAWASALGVWKTELMSALTLAGNASGAIATAGVMTMKNAILTATIAVVTGVGVGFAGNELLSQSDTDMHAASTDSTNTETASKSGSESDSPTPISRAEFEKVEKERDALKVKITTLEETTRKAQGSQATLNTPSDADFVPRAEFVALQERFDSLKAEAADYLAKVAEAKPIFTFGDVGKLGAIRDSDWSELASASTIVIDSIAELALARKEGRPPAEGTQIRLQQNTERMRKFEYAAKEQNFPTWAEQNGELTHPVTMANLIAKTLEQAQMPLSASQVERVTKAGKEYDQEWQHYQSSYAQTTVRAQKMLDEYNIKGKFLDTVYALLSNDQRTKLINPETLHRARLDLMCPTLMVIHTSPTLAAKDVNELKTKLIERLATPSEGRNYFDSFGRYGLSAEEMQQVTPLIDQWATDVSRICQPVDKGIVNNYTFEEARIAGEATIRLFQKMLEVVANNESVSEQIRNAPTFLIPRIVEE